MRGKILRDTSHGDGVLFVDGGQKSFSLEKHWRSPNPPRTGALVDVQMNEAGDVLSVSEVSQAEALKEQARKAGAVLSSQSHAGLEAVKAQAHKAGVLIQEEGAAGAGQAVLVSAASRRGAWPLLLGALGLLLLTWVYMPLVNIQVFGMKSSVSLWEGTQGFYAFMMVVALLLPLLPLVWRNPVAHLGKCAPALYMLWMVFVVTNGVRSGMDAAGGLLGQRVRSQVSQQLMSMFSLGYGFYVAAAIALALLAVGIYAFVKQRKEALLT